MKVGTDNWLEGVRRKPGPANKTYTQINAQKGIVLHSMEGSYLGSVQGVLLNQDRRASWMLSLRKTGELVQHYAVDASPWANGSLAANITYWSLELDGTKDEPINDKQIATLMELCRAFEEHTGLKAVRSFGADNTLYEHKQLAQTACPSGRYDPFYLAWAMENQEEPMPDDPIAALNLALMQREDIRHVASGDLKNVVTAHATLAKKGLVPERKLPE